MKHGNPWWQRCTQLRLACALACVLACALASGVALAAEPLTAEHHGQVTFAGLPVPGAAVTATRGDKTLTAVTDDQGFYNFPDLPEGKWKVAVKMTGFVTAELDVTSTVAGPGLKWELKMLSLEQLLAQARVVKADAPAIVATNTVTGPVKKDAPKADAAAEAPKPAAEEQSSDGFLVNGSVNNAATSQFSMAQAFGNTRKGSKGLYTGGLSLELDNSSLDAKPYSLSGGETPKTSYNRLTVGLTFGGPLRIPRLMPRGPNFFLVYQRTRNQDAEVVSGLVPTVAQRSGVLPTGTVTVSPQAAALLALYPLPNIVSNAGYNYQAPVTSNSHVDVGQMRLDKNVTRKDNVYGTVAMQSIRSDNSNLFAFRDTTAVLGIRADVNWDRHVHQGLYNNLGYKFSRLRTQVTPYFQGRGNVSGAAGITGNDQNPENWGPPSLVFSSGISSLDDAQSAFNRNRTEGVSETMHWYHRAHNVTFGGDFRRQEYNYLSQQNPRGTFAFTGAATNVSDFADFLAGRPDTAALAYGNADKYLRQSVYDAFVTDDWRILPELTINAGVRWEYGAPITELKGRLVNLDVAPGFTAVTPVVATNPVGTLTGQRYPTSLVRPDKTMFEPRVGVSWRPIPGSSVVVRAGYGIYADTSIYLRNALRMAVQPPLARSLSVANSVACPLTLATGLAQVQCDAETFGVDPNFRVGYAQTWQVAVQRDLPAALQATATYLGVNGSNGVQQSLPNSYALGGAKPCTQCPSGFYYRGSGGTSSRNAASLQLRRRLRGGLTATATYTWSKSVDDDAALGGQGATAGGSTTQSSGNSQPAQNWMDLHAERSLSTFDQRHLVNATLQYTSGQGLGGGSLLGGWRGRLLKEWTAVGTVVAGSGLPENPIYLAVVPGTGETGLLRPDRVSTSLYTGTPGRFVNAAAYAAPQAGRFGTAGRNSIEGPSQFALSASVSRTFRVTKKYNLDVRVDSTNLLNHVVFTGYNTVLNPVTNALPTPALSSPLFGVPVGANAMRTLQTTARLRF